MSPTRFVAGLLILGGVPLLATPGEARVSPNALSMNAVNVNAVNVNALSMNAVNVNALTHNALTHNALHANGVGVDAWTLTPRGITLPSGLALALPE